MPRNYDINKPTINYLNKDFVDLKGELINYVKTYFPNTYQDFNETSPGMMMMELNAYVGDILSFYIDQQFKEMFLTTAEEKENVVNLARTLGYKIKPTVPSIVKLKFEHIVSAQGIGPNMQPNMDEALTINKGMVVQSNVNDSTFETIDIVDFNLTSSILPQIYETHPSTGVPTKYKLTQNAVAISGKTKEIVFNASTPKPFRRFTIPDKNVSSIISVKDTNGKDWYEVDYLAQDKIYSETHYLDDAQRNSTSGAYTDNSQVTPSQVSVPVPYKLNDMISVKKRFVVETNADNTTSLIFGNGINKNHQGAETYIQQVFDETNTLNALVNGNLPTSLNPTIGIAEYGSLGESPSNTSLTVKYRVGGGVKSNVPAGSLTSILSKSPIGSTNTAAEVSMTVINNDPAGGGSNFESIREIKENTKAHFSSQYRAVTKEDYVSRIKSMPSRFGSVAKVHVTRRAFNEFTGSGPNNFFSPFDYSGSDGVVGGSNDALYFSASMARALSGNATAADLTKMSVVEGWINNLSTAPVSAVLQYKNLDVYLLSYDHNNNLIQTPYIIKDNLRNYLRQYQVISDDIEVKDGIVINFGVKFRVESKSFYNKSEIKIKCINEIINYFATPNMDFQQTLFIADLENLLYGVDGVKVVKEVTITQDASTLGLSSYLYAEYGIPTNNVGGQASDEYGFAYEGFLNPVDGKIVPPPHLSTPGVFELKNPKDNVKGQVD